MRRPLLAVGLLTAVLLAVATPATGETAEFAGQWSGTTVTLASGGTGLQVSSSIVWQRPPLTANPHAFRVGLVVVGPERESCPLPADTSDEDHNPQPHPTRTRTWTANPGHAVPFTCNGTYDVIVDVQAFQSGVASDTAFRPLTVAVATPPATPKDLAASLTNTGSVSLSWKPGGPAAPDFIGYTIERSIDGDVEVLGTDVVGTSFTDFEVDLGPGDEATYRVKATREGATEGSRVSSSATTASVSIPDPEATTTTTEPDDDPEGTGADPDHADVIEAGDGDGDGTGTGAARLPRTGSGRAPVGPMRPVTPTTLDTGFAESLPFDPDRITGPADAVPPGDEFASLIYDDPEGAGLAVPGATAAVLAVWAMHLRHLNQLARRDP